MISILLVDDHPSVRAGLKLRFGLEPDLQIVGEADDGLSAVQMAQALQPQVILLDAEMPKMNGFAAASSLRNQVPQSAIVILTAHDNDEMRALAAASGANVFMCKESYVEPLISAIRALANHPAHLFA